MRCLDCLFGGPFLIMLLPAFNHLGDLLRVLRRGVVAPHLRFYPMFLGSPSGFLLLNPPRSVYPCIFLYLLSPFACLKDQYSMEQKWSDTNRMIDGKSLEKCRPGRRSGGRP